MKINFNDHDGLIVCAVNRRKGIWASSLLLRGNATVRQAGHIGAPNLSVFNLHSISLANALRGIGSKQRTQFEWKTGDGSARKLRLLVVSENADWIAQSQGNAVSRIAGNFREDLDKQISNYDLSFQVENPRETRTAQLLMNWAERVVAPVRHLPAILQRRAFSEVVY